MQRKSQSQLNDERFFNQFLQELEPLKSESAIESLCKVWLEKIKAYCTSLSTKQDEQGNKVLNINTYNEKLRRFRNQIIDWQKTQSLTTANSYKADVRDSDKSFRGKIHFAFKYLKETKEFYRERTAQSLKKSENREQESEPISLEVVEKYIATATKLIASYDWREVVVGVIALTGRRFGEGIKTANFEPTSLYKVRFTGQLKHGREDYEMFSLIESHIIADANDRLRNMPEIKTLKAEDIEQITNDKNSTVNNCVKAHFGEFLPVLPEEKGSGKLSTRSLRYVYAAIALYWFCNPRKNNTTFYKEQLGHVSKVAAFSYIAFQVCDNEGVPYTTGIKQKLLDLDAKVTEKKEVRLRISEEQKAKFDELQKLWGCENQATAFDLLLRYAELGINNAPIADVKTDEITEETKEETKEEKSKDVDLKTVSWSDLKTKYRTVSGSAYERLNRAVKAISDYNSITLNNSNRWRITTPILVQLTGTRSDIVSKFYAENKAEIDRYNESYNFGIQHNKGKGNVTDFIQIK